MEREKQLRAVTIGEPQLVEGAIVLVDYDPAWPEVFAGEAARITGALGEQVLLLEHVGSTSVPGLAAKPIIDVLLGVTDSADEAAYAPALEAAGYVLRIREPNWYEHRMFRGRQPQVNLHIFSEGCEEIERMLAFREQLRHSRAERDRYETVKRELAQRWWKYGQDYADAKGPVVEEILARADSKD